MPLPPLPQTALPPAGSGAAPNAGMFPGYPQDMSMVMDDMVAKPETHGLRRGWTGGTMGMMTIVRVVTPETLRHDPGAEGGAGEKGGRAMKTAGARCSIRTPCVTSAGADRRPAAHDARTNWSSSRFRTTPRPRRLPQAIEAARERTRQAGAWPNPSIGYSGEEIKTGDLDTRGEHGFFVEQTIPLGGKLGLSRSVVQNDDRAGRSGA